MKFSNGQLPKTEDISNAIVHIYFAASIRGGREDISVYTSLITHLSKYARVLTEHVGNRNLAAWGEDGLTDEEIYQRDMGWLASARAVVAEVSNPSLGVGYEVCAGSLIYHLPTLCLYRKQEGKRLSAMIAGAPGLIVAPYESLDDARALLDQYVPQLLGLPRRHHETS